jgi:hypothetical protein
MPMRSLPALAVAMASLVISIVALVVALGRPAREPPAPSAAREPATASSIAPSLPEQETPDAEPAPPAQADPEEKQPEARIAAIETRVEEVRVLLSNMAKTFFVEADVERPALVTKEHHVDYGEIICEFVSLDLAEMAAEAVLAVEYEYRNSKGELAWDRCAEGEFTVKEGKLLLRTKWYQEGAVADRWQVRSRFKVLAR